MPCKQCVGGSVECGPNGTLLCKPGEGWTKVGCFCFDVFTRRDKYGDCQVKITPAKCDCDKKKVVRRRARPAT